MTLSDKFYNRMREDHHGYSLENDDYIIRIAKYLAKLSPLDYSLDSKDFNESLPIIEEILSIINPEYTKLFKQMLAEQNQDNPVIYIYNSSSKDTKRNESFTYANEIHFYQTNTISDIYLLLHEFTHFLMNRKNIYSNNKINNEIAPILIEFIISNYLNDYNYLRQRLEYLIFDAKSLLAKKDLINTNSNPKDLFIKYNFTEEEIEEFETELLCSKSLKYEEERNYLYGLINAYYYSINNDITNYQTLVNQLTNTKNIPFNKLPISILDELIAKISNTNNKHL